MSVKIYFYWLFMLLHVSIGIFFHNNKQKVLHSFDCTTYLHLFPIANDQLYRIVYHLFKQHFIVMLLRMQIY
ncbi:hypothetical protein B0A77_08695 [Flavobacterium branchiophilum]|uniref:Uncharacterized protein n=1 Tax=Flavobacterium branchiophilum TaxID=55197 RepID=A0A2H3KUZ9_9FLAO|nr:hypothetical protein B0A77_08695 [Flavobacterium branchiophilum]